MGHVRTGVAVGVAVLSVVLAACSTPATLPEPSPPPSPTSPDAPATSTPTPPVTTPPASASETPGGTATDAATPGQAATDAGSEPAAPVAGGPVPDGFEPSSATVAADGTLWVLGDAPCDDPPCTSLLRWTGDELVGVPAPRTELAEGRQRTEGVRAVRFSAATHGWAFRPDLWATQDGARTWHEVDADGDVVALAAGADRVWAVTADCSGGTSCTEPQLRAGAVDEDALAPVVLPTPLHGAPDLSVDDEMVVVLDGVSETGTGAVTLLVSTDGGGSFTEHGSPCTAGFGGRVTAASGAIWTVCPTGMQAAVFRSDDEGATFQQIQPPVPLHNGAIVAAADRDEGVVTGPGSLLHTEDGGESWAEADVPVAVEVWHEVGMDDQGVGYAIGSADGARLLLRTHDGGASWQLARLP